MADSEADIYDIFVEAQAQTGTRAEYIIRAKEDRSTMERNPAAGKAAYHKVRDEVQRSTVLATRVIKLEATPKRKARQATIEIRALTVQVKPPHARSHLPPVTVSIVMAVEVGGPGDGTDISWLLITTLPIGTVDEVLKIVDYYGARWIVEVFFRTLKTGCCVEEIQLETNRRLKNCLAFYNIIAWRILYLTYMNRTTPALPCTAVFDDAEWKSVWRVVTHKSLPPTPPSLSEFMKLLSQLGGHNNRTRDRAPGPQTIWSGMRRMLDFATAWLNFGPERDQTYV